MSWGLIEPYGGPQFEFLSNEDVVYFLSEPNFWIVMTITAVAGFLINIAIFLQIKVTTPLTNTISGTAKVCPGLHQGAHGRRADTRLKLCYTAHRRVCRRCWAGSFSKTTSRPSYVDQAPSWSRIETPCSPFACGPHGRTQNGVGILLSLGGTGWYSWIRYKEMVSK